MPTIPENGPGARTQAASSTTPSTYNPTDSALIFASEWHFKPEGVKAVKERFELELEKKQIEAYHVWDENSQNFQLRCLSRHTEIVWKLFYKVITAILKEEGAEEYQDGYLDDSYGYEYSDEDLTINSRKIQRLEFWRLDRESAQFFGQQQSTLDQTGEASYPAKIKPFPYKGTWSEQDEKENLDAIILDEYLDELAKLTGCQFVKALNTGTIFIGCESEENVQLSKKKLDTILKNFRYRGTYAWHLFYSEDVDDFQLCPRYVEHIGKYYLKTTLLDCLQVCQNTHDYFNLHKAVSIRIATWHKQQHTYLASKALKFNNAVKADDKNIPLTEWLDFKYSPHGEPLDNPLVLLQDISFQQAQKRKESLNASAELSTKTQLKQHRLKKVPVTQQSAIQLHPIEEKQENKIRDWVEQVPKIGLEGNSTFSSSTFPSALSGADNDNSGQNLRDKFVEFKPQSTFTREYLVSDTKTLMTQTKRYLKAVESSQNSHLDRLVISPISNALPQVPNPMPLLSNESRSIFPTRSSQFNSTGRGPRAQVNRAATVTHSRPKRLVNPQFLDEPDDKEKKVSLLDEDVSFDFPIHRDMEQIRTDQTAALVEPTTQTEVENLIDLSDADTAPCPKPDESVARVEQRSLIDISEVDTRRFHTTMNQKAPKRKPNPFPGRLPVPSLGKIKDREPIHIFDPKQDFIDQIGIRFEHMMSGVRGLRGRLAVQAEFGRILVRNLNPNFVSTLQTDRIHEEHFLESCLLDTDLHAAKTFFTKVLTTASGDIPYLLTTEDRGGNHLWNRTVSSWSVTYEFWCVDLLIPLEPFTVAIDGETSVTSIMSRRELGNIYIHGLKRHWDFKVAARLSEVGRNLEEKYGQLATLIQTSLYIPSGRTKPEVSFILTEALLERFHISEIRVLRSCEYRSKDRKSTLKITEVQSLDITQDPIPTKKQDVFNASLGSSNLGPRIWHEASISSIKLNELLEQHQELELGDEAGWTVEDLSRHKVVEDFYRPACQMLKQMDGVGQHNDNEIAARFTANSVPMTMRSENQQFW